MVISSEGKPHKLKMSFQFLIAVIDLRGEATQAVSVAMISGLEPFLFSSLILQKFQKFSLSCIQNIQ